MFWKVWHTFADPKHRYPSAKELLGFCTAHYLFPLQHLQASTYQGVPSAGSCHPTCQWAFVSYHRLLVDLELSVFELMKRLQYIVSSSDFKRDSLDEHCSSSGDDGGGGGSSDTLWEDGTPTHSFRCYLRAQQVLAGMNFDTCCFKVFFTLFYNC
jgi:hypothetical protein